jgi:hypothetical protein
MNDFEESIKRHIEIMNISFEESEKPEDEYTKDFRRVFERSSEHVERLLRIRAKANGVSQ